MMSNPFIVIEGPDRKKSFEIVILDKNSISIIFGEMVYALSFFQYGSEIQKLLEERIIIDEKGNQIDVSYINNIQIDLTKIVWFDTLALGYLILFLNDSFDKYKKQKIEFSLPDNPQFLSFLADNGFYNQIQKIDASISIQSEWLNQTYSQIHDCLYKFEIIESRNEIQEKIANIQLLIKNIFMDQYKPDQLEHLINKLSYFLFETLENVYDHAYQEKNGRCGIIIKHVNCSNGINYKKYAAEYTSKTPYVKINLFEDNTSYLEVYVFDTGCGLKKSFSDDLNLNDRNIIEFVFDKGERSSRKAKKVATKFGGLYDIRELFEQDADGLGIKSDSVWKYVYKFNKQNDFYLVNQNKPVNESEGLIHGFALVASIHLMQNPTDLSKDDKDLDGCSNTILEDLFASNSEKELIKKALVIDERWDTSILREWQKEEKKDNLVIYPPATAMKNWIVTHIFNCEFENLFFLEVPEVETKKYITNISGIRCNIVKTKKIFVITKTLDVFVFLPGEEGFFEIANEEKLKYINTFFSSNISLSKSFSTLLIFDKLYNSWRFWDMILQLMGKYTYVPELVKWDKVEEIDLNGYLDFSQVNRIPACRDICIQKLNELRVLKNDVYFNSVDRFTDEVCDRANYILGGEKDKIHVNIGSVFVSGKSNRLLSENDDCYYFLCHPNSKNKNVRTLLQWLKEDKLPPIEHADSTNELNRLGNSSFIARRGADYWLSKHYSVYPKGFKLNSSTLYKLLQRKIGLHPDTLKIGHFENAERHDFFWYRINYWFDTDSVVRQLNPQFENESIFDFLLTNFIYSLYGKVTKAEFNGFLNDSLSIGKKGALWSKYKQAENSLPKAKEGVLVYFSDFQTSILVERIEKFLSKETIKKIIPLIPLSRNYEMGSLLLSPLILDRIEEQIERIKKENNTVNITVFDSVAFNVRIIEEVKQILYGIGANSVKILTVLDRRRIPIVETQPSIVALGRVDSPALHDNNRCTACKALDRLNYCRKQVLNEDMKSRIDEIISRWQCIKISDNEYLKGMEPKKIFLLPKTQEIIAPYCNNYLGGTIDISLDLAFCSLVVEYTVISASAQLLIILLEESELIDEGRGELTSDELKLLLASSYILLFAANPISNKQVYKIVEHLKKLLDEQKCVSIYSGLALVALSSLDEQYLRCLCDNYTVFESDDISCNKKMNVDSLLARIVTVLSLQRLTDFRTNDLLERRIRSYLIGNQSKLECLYDIFMYSEKSYENSHRHAYARIIDKSAPSPGDYQNALQYTRKIINIVGNNAVYASLFHDNNILENNKESVILELKKAQEELETKVKSLEENVLQIEEGEDSVRESVKKAIQSLAKMNTKALYLRMAPNKDSDEYRSIIEWLTYCRDIAKTRINHKREAVFHFDVQASMPYYTRDDAKTTFQTQKWFYSHREVTEEVINLMVDILQYQSDKIPANTKQNNLYDGIIKVVYCERFVEICFYNAASRDIEIEEIRDIKNSKSNRDSMLVFKEFEKRLNFGDHPQINCFEWDYLDLNFPGNGNCLFRATMRIPYINRGSANSIVDVFYRKEN